MFPWEHAAVAYLCYAGVVRWRNRTAPTGWPVLVVLVASQLPDLLDKPLAWQVGLLPSGRSLAHSVVVGVPLACVAVALARRYERPALGPAVAIGYLSHLVTDAVPVYPGGELTSAVVLWPFVTADSAPDATGQAAGGAVARTGDTLLGAYPSLGAGEPTLAVGVRLGLVGLAGGLWLADGCPGLRAVRALLRWPLTVLQSRRLWP